VRPLALSVTPAPRRALEVLAKHGWARESNQTRDDPEQPAIYWQSRAWLSKQGLVAHHKKRGEFYWVLTDAGLELCRDLAMAPEQLKLFA
jgi:hypothetical protein